MRCTTRDQQALYNLSNTLLQEEKRLSPKTGVKPILTGSQNDIFEKSVIKGALHFKSDELVTLVTALNGLQLDPMSKEKAETLCQALESWMDRQPEEYCARGALVPHLLMELHHCYDATSKFSPNIAKVLKQANHYRKQPNTRHYSLLVSALAEWKAARIYDPVHFNRMTTSDPIRPHLLDEIGHYCTKLKSHNNEKKWAANEAFSRSTSQKQSSKSKPHLRSEQSKDIGSRRIELGAIPLAIAHFFQDISFSDILPDSNDMIDLVENVGFDLAETLTSGT